MIFLIIYIYIGGYVFVPHITIVNNSDMDIETISYQYLGVVRENNIEPIKDDEIVYMARKKNIYLKKGDKKTFKANLFALNDKENTAQIDAFEVYWYNTKNNLIRYEIIKENKNKSSCSSVITVENNNYIIEENPRGFCLRRINRFF